MELYRIQYQGLMRVIIAPETEFVIRINATSLFSPPLMYIYE
jgi:hypothetical protein